MRPGKSTKYPSPLFERPFSRVDCRITVLTCTYGQAEVSDGPKRLALGAGPAMIR